MNRKTQTMIDKIKSDKPNSLNLTKGKVYETDTFFPKILSPCFRSVDYEKEFQNKINSKRSSMTTINPLIKNQLSYRNDSYMGKNSYYKITHASPRLKDIFDMEIRKYKYY